MGDRDGKSEGKGWGWFLESWEIERDVWEEEEGQREDGGTWEGRNKNPSQWAQREECQEGKVADRCGWREMKKTGGHLEENEI